jgi:Uma2 family endonuclease
MATAPHPHPHSGPAIILEDFLARPDIDEKPHKEFVGGHVEEIMSPHLRQSKLRKMLTRRLDAFAAEHDDLGEAFPELRETLPEDGQLSGDPVSPGFTLPVAEIWSWLRPGR